MGLSNMAHAFFYMTFSHESVMPAESLEYLDVQEGKIYVDCTLGGGGHSRQILNALNGTGHLYMFDQDLNVIEKQKADFKAEFPDWSNYTFVHSNFSELADYCKENNLKISGGVMMDLGISSIQLDDPERGFSFLSDGPIDMRMNQDEGVSASELVNTYREEDIANIIYKYGDERFSRKIAQFIMNARPIETTKQLSDLVIKVYSRKSSTRSKIHPATRTFQALRVYVNKELESLESLLRSAREFLEPSARIVVLSFQSQEDRIVKWSFREGAKEPQNEKLFKILTKRPILPSDNEIDNNLRSRSAKLRAVEVEDAKRY